MSMTIRSGNDMSFLFSSLNGNQGGNGFSNNMGISLSDYASLKNGSYGKLTKAYYTKNSSKAEKAEEEDDKSSAATEKKVASSASSLVDAASALTDNKSLFEKTKTIKKEDGTQTKDYDWDAITDKVGSFVKSYNATLDRACESGNNGVLTAGYSMVKGTAIHANALSKVGITVTSDNSLSLDADKLKSANINDIKALFSGQSSYASTVSGTASIINTRAMGAASNGYNSAGGYAGLTSTSSVMDTYL